MRGHAGNPERIRPLRGGTSERIRGSALRAKIAGKWDGCWNAPTQWGAPRQSVGEGERWLALAAPAQLARMALQGFLGW